MMSPSTAVAAASIAIRAYMTELFAKSGSRALYKFFADMMPAGTELTQSIMVLEALPVMRKWVGSRHFPDAMFRKLDASVDTYEKSFKEKRKVINSLAGEVLMAALQRWAGSPDRDLDKILTDFLFTNPTCYDGGSLFATNHPGGPSDSPTQGNYSTTALSGPQHRAVLTAGSSLRDENGEPLEVQYRILMVGPKLAPLARALTGSQRQISINNTGAEATSGVVATSTSPVFDMQVFDGGEILVVVNPRFVGTAHENKYLYLDPSMGVYPVVAFPGEVQVDTITEPTSEIVFMHDEYAFGVRLDITLLAGAWHTAFLGNP